MNFWVSRNRSEKDKIYFAAVNYKIILSMLLQLNWDKGNTINWKIKNNVC